MEAVPDILEDTSVKTAGIIKRTDKFLIKDIELYEKTKLCSKVIYDVTKLIEVKGNRSTLPELIIDNFDSEQVWAGIELQNKHKINEFESKFSSVSVSDLTKFSLLLGKDKPKPSDAKLAVTDEVDPEEDALSENDKQGQDSDFDNDGDHNNLDEQNSDQVDNNNEDLDEEKELDILNDPDFQNMSDSDGDDLPLFGDLNDDDLNEEGEGTFKERERTSCKKKSIVDDKFFKLSEMEKFLECEDKKEMNNDEQKSDEDELDLFNTGDDEDEEEEKEMYNDYFQDEITDYGNDDQDSASDVEDEDEDDQEERAENPKMPPPDAFSKLLPSSDDEDDDKPSKSSHEIAEERLAKKIGRLEEAAVGEKAWQMGGEAGAPVRPENSLLAEHLDYDTAARQAPVVTEHVSRKLEDIIKQRIKDKAWDDVERKAKPVEDPYEYKKKLVLDQEKSKQSLAQVYEEEYLKLAENATKKPESVGLLDKEEDEMPSEVIEIKDMMNTLFKKLDSLTHLHYTPKQKSAELKIIRNIASINIEEVAPVATSNAALLAPAEVVDKKKGELMENNEKSITDRKRERRAKKAKKKAEVKEKEKRESLVEKLKPGLGNKYSKEKALKKLEDADKSGKVINLNKKEKDLSVKTSKAFFTSLQEEVKTHTKERNAEQTKKKKGSNTNIASLKL